MKVRKTNLIVYCSHFLSCWGTRMWQFGMGMFLVRIADGSLQLTAAYGLATGVAIFLFGALLGDWVDNTPRLKAAQLSLVVTDVFMFASSAVISGYLWFQDAIKGGDSWLAPTLQALMVAFAVLSDLTAQARIIAVERDWVVEICGKDSDHLATMTSMLRRIDMFSMIVAPIATGHIMTYIDLVVGAIFIGAWNVVSVFVEFYLMWKVYNTVPALKAKKDARRTDDFLKMEPIEEVRHKSVSESHHNNENKPNDGEPQCDHGEMRVSDGIPQDTDTKLQNNDSTKQHRDGETQYAGSERQEGEEQLTGCETHDADNETQSSNGRERLTNDNTQNADSDTPHTSGRTVGPLGAVQEENTANIFEVVFEVGHMDVEAAAHDQSSDVTRNGCKCSHVLSQFVTLWRGFRTYLKYNVALAGLALAFLYMTVLGFHHVTVAYAITQGLSESVLGILSGASAVFGILGTFAYPYIRRRAGLIRTGIIALSCEVSCLTLCVASIWLPGSPFDPYYTRSGSGLSSFDCGTSNASIPDQAAMPVDIREQTTVASNSSSILISRDYLTPNDVTTSDCHLAGNQGPDSYVSLVFLMTGIFLSRFGLWVADLTITQLFLEKVVETERGIVNGFQASLNQFFDLLKYATVVALPDTETFGFLIIISFSFVASAWVVYAVFVHREGLAVCSCDCVGERRSDMRNAKTESESQRV